MSPPGPSDFEALEKPVGRAWVRRVGGRNIWLRYRFHDTQVTCSRSRRSRGFSYSLDSDARRSGVIEVFFIGVPFWAHSSNARSGAKVLPGDAEQAPWLLMVMSATFVTMKAKKARVVPAGEFKAKCLALFDQVETRGQSFVVTKRGRPVARVVPLAATKPSSLLGSLLHEEELLEPIDVEWDAHS